MKLVVGPVSGGGTAPGPGTGAPPPPVPEDNGLVDSTSWTLPEAFAKPGYDYIKVVMTETGTAQALFYAELVSMEDVKPTESS